MIIKNEIIIKCLNCDSENIEVIKNSDINETPKKITRIKIIESKNCHTISKIIMSNEIIENNILM